MSSDPVNYVDPKGLYRCSVVTTITSSLVDEPNTMAEVYCESEGHSAWSYTYVTPYHGDAQALLNTFRGHGEQLDKIEQDVSLRNAIARAKQAFSDTKPCRDLFFADVDPSLVLDHLLAGDAQFGSFAWADHGAGASAGITSGGKFVGTGWTSIVTLNSNGKGDWFAPSNGYGPYDVVTLNAKTIIHELGHVYENMFGPSSTKILNDSQGGGIGNSEFIMQECFGRKPW